MLTRFYYVYIGKDTLKDRQISDSTFIFHPTEPYVKTAPSYDISLPSLTFISKCAHSEDCDVLRSSLSTEKDLRSRMPSLYGEGRPSLSRCNVQYILKNRLRKK